MKTNDKYRFSLQWSAENTEKVQAGDFINSLGNRKSEFIVTAVTEYISAHPEVQINGQKPQVLIKPCFTHAELEEMVRAIIAENVSNTSPQKLVKVDAVAEPVPDEADIAAMLNNLDAFLQ